mgnify:CR=1 FL=1
MKKFFSFILIFACFFSKISFAGVKETLSSMTLEQKIGQLFIIRPDALDITLSSDEINDSKAQGVDAVNKTMLETLKKYPAGGFVFFRKNIRTPKQLKKFTRALKDSSEIFPIIAIDEEGGKISRIANAKNFNVKKFESVQKIAESKKSREAGKIIGTYLKEYGFNFDFAPVADVNTNPENIVIGDRAFGNNPDFVAENVSEFLEGLHSQGVAGCLKHFPGHGDTKGDTHEDSVNVYKTWEELLKAEIIPFKENLSKADSVMTAHITMKNIDGLPATLSREIITNKLRKELGYDGLIITDAMIMKAIANKYSSSEAAILAIEAGNDIILMPYDYIEAFEGVLNAVKSGRISEERLNESVMRILELKEKLKLKWWQKKPVYQIYPKSFLDTKGSGTGDIRGIINKLDYIKSLDVGAIWLTPIYPSPMIDNGYDISDYTGINERFGTMKDFDELIAEADKRDIKIVMDLVFNHTSDQHSWFLESKKNKTNPKADWYIWRDAKDGHEPTNWRGIFGGSAWTWCEERQQYYLHTFAKQQPDLNWENPEVRRALYDAANFWLNKGVGGFRIDAITYIKKPAEFLDGKPDSKEGSINIHLMTANRPGILDFLREFKREVFEGKDIFTVGEANGVNPEELKDWVGDKGVFDMLFEFSIVSLPFDKFEIWCHPREWKLTELKQALTASQNATKINGWYPMFFENHDQPRSVNHFFPEGADPKKAAKALAVILMTMRGTPFIYQGQELGMTNVSWNDINNYDDISSHGQYEIALKEGFSPDEAMKFIRYFSRDNARTPMQWNGKPNSGFSDEKIKTWLPVNENYKFINAELEEKDPDSVLKFYRKLSALRNSNEELIAGDYHEIFSDSEEIFAFERSLNDKKIITVVNFSLNPVKVPEEIANKKIILSSEKDFNDSELKPLEARIYKNN